MRIVNGDSGDAVWETFEETADGLRAWSTGRPPWVGAAIEFLIWHEGWLRRRDFLAACTHYRPEQTVEIDWAAAGQFVESGPRASTSELSVLRAAIDLGGDRYHIGNLGSARRAALVRAFTAAVRVPA